MKAKCYPDSGKICLRFSSTVPCVLSNQPVLTSRLEIIYKFQSRFYLIRLILYLPGLCDFYICCGGFLYKFNHFVMCFCIEFMRKILQNYNIFLLRKYCILSSCHIDLVRNSVGFYMKFTIIIMCCI